MTPYSGSFCSFVTVRVPAHNLNDPPKYPYVGYFGARILLPDYKMPGYLDGMDARNLKVPRIHEIDWEPSVPNPI